VSAPVHGVAFGMEKITAKLIETVSLSSQKRARIIRDLDLKGFGLRITSGAITFVVEARVNGTRKRISIGRADLLSVEEARAKAIKLLAQMTCGVDPVEQKRKEQLTGMTLHEALYEYISTRELRPASRYNYRQVIKTKLEDWLRLPVVKITREMVAVRHREITMGFGRFKASPVQANCTMQALRIMINYAKRKMPDEIRKSFENPVSILTESRSWNRTNQRQGIIPDDKLADLHKALTNPNTRDFLLTCLFTGLRSRDVMSLKWSDIDFARRVLTVSGTQSKNHREHRLPISTPLFDLLTARKQKRKAEYIFPGKQRPHMVQAFFMTESVGRKMKHPFTIHDIRRTVLTMADKIGAPYPVIKKLANHSMKGRDDVTLGYLVITVERLREPMEKICQRFVELMQREKCLADLLEDFLAAKNLKGRGTPLYRCTARKWFQDWLDLPLSQVTNEMLAQRHREIIESSSKQRATFAIWLFGKLCQYQGLPAPVVQSLPSRAINQRRIGDKKLPRWYQAVMSIQNTDVRDYLLFLLFTGTYRKEALELGWSDVDFRSRTLRLGTRRLPVSAFVIDMLRQRQKITDSDFVFSCKKTTRQKFTNEAIEAFGGSFTANDLRRTFLSVGWRNFKYTSVLLLDGEAKDLRNPVERIGLRLMTLMKISQENLAIPNTQ
jgi:integrase